MAKEKIFYIHIAMFCTDNEVNYILHQTKAPSLREAIKKVSCHWAEFLSNEGADTSFLTIPFKHVNVRKPPPPMTGETIKIPTLCEVDEAEAFWIINTVNIITVEVNEIQDWNIEVINETETSNI